MKRRTKRNWGRPIGPDIRKWEIFDMIGYTPNDDQRMFHECETRFKVTFGGERSGKSMTAARDFEADLFKEGFRLWILGSQYATIEGAFGWLWRDLVEVLDLAVEKYSYSTSPPRFYLRFEWGAEIESRTAKNLCAVRSVPVDGMILTEAGDMPSPVWDDFARGRLSDREGRAVIEGCPVGYDWFVELGERGHRDDPDWATFHLSAEKTLPPADLAEKRRNYSRALYEQKVLGNPMSVEGLVYSPEFHDEVSVIPWTFRPDWLTWLGVDFGYRFPSLGWTQTSGANPLAPDFVAVHFDQFVEDNVTIERLIDVALSRPYQLGGIFCDPAGDGADSTGFSDFKRLRAECRKRGIVEPSYCPAPIWRHIPTGVEKLRMLLCAADGTRRFFIAKHLKDNSIRRGVWRAFHMYQYPDVKPGRVKSDIPVKDGVSDHKMDELRYWCINLFSRAAQLGASPRSKRTESRFPGVRRRFSRGPGAGGAA